MQVVEACLDVCIVARQLDDERAVSGILYLVDVAVNDVDVYAFVADESAHDRLVCAVAYEGEAKDEVAAFDRCVGELDVCEERRKLVADDGADEFTRDLLFGMHEYFCDRTFFDDVAAADDGYLVADLFDNVHLMCDEHDGELELLVDVFEKIEDRFGRLRVECARCFVAEEHFRVAGKCTCDTDALFLTARELRRILVAFVREAYEFEEREHLGFDLGLAFADELERECDVVEYGARRQKVEVLEDHADVFARRTKSAVIHFRKVFAVDDNCAAGRTFEHVHAADEGRFARAALADDAEDVAFGYMEINAAKGRHATASAGFVCFFKVDYFDHCICLAS